MQLQANPESIPFFLATAISIALATFAWRRRARPIARAFALMMAGEAAWALFEALELVIVDIETQKTLLRAARDRHRDHDFEPVGDRAALHRPRSMGQTASIYPDLCPVALAARARLDQSLAPSLLDQTLERLDQWPLDRDAGLRALLQGSLCLLLPPGGGRLPSCWPRRFTARPGSIAPRPPSCSSE